MAEVLTKSICSRCLCFSSSPKKNPSFSSLAGFPPLKLQPLKSSSNSQFHGRKIVLQQVDRGLQGPSLRALPIQMRISIGKAWKWWEKGLQPNMKEITSAQDLVDSLLSAGDKLVIVDFYSPSCGGCKALHPKICQFAEMNPDVQFLQVNHEEHKSMCYSLNVHVLPFFRFYRGAHGRLCSFSCTNATIKKFKDALANHTTERCSLGPPRGLEESELVALAANKHLPLKYPPKISASPPLPVAAPQEETAKPLSANLSLLVPSNSRPIIDFEDKALITTAGR